MVLGWFKKKAEQHHVKVTEDKTLQSIEHLQSTLSLLEKKEALIEKNITKEEEHARQLIAQQKREQAKACLIRKKKLQTDLDKIQKQKENLQVMINQVEEASLNVEVLKTQQQAAHGLKNAYGAMDVDKIEDQMEDLRDTMQNANAISDALAQSIDSNVVDEDELEDEFNMLQNAVDLESKKVAAPLAKASSAAASQRMKTKKEEVVDDGELEDEFAELQAQLA